MNFGLRTALAAITLLLLSSKVLAYNETFSANNAITLMKSANIGSANILTQLSSRQLKILNQAAAIVGSGQLPSGYNSWNDYATYIYNKLALSQKQLDALLKSVNNGKIPDGYNSWEEYGNSLINNPTEINALLSKISAFSSASQMYQKAQNALLTMPTALLVGGYLNQLNSYDQAFQNMDMQMMLPYKTRIAYKYGNKLALADSSKKLPTKYEPPKFQSFKEEKNYNGMWVRPYVSIGSINFKNGPKVDNTMYGIYMGGDSGIKHLKHSDFQYSAYIGYNGSHQTFGDNSIYSNGGLFGLTGAWYREKAFTLLTVNAGASNAELDTFYTKKDYPMFAAGVASKTGYNFEMADGKFIIQPSYLMSYSFVTPFNKGSIAGMNIDSKPLNVLNISPGIKFIGNLNHGWQPYAEARMVWNLMGKTDYSTEFVDVPSISIKPYAQYGVGIQKLWGDFVTGFIQFTMRSGGRNDVAFFGGLKCAIGRKKDKI